MLQARSAGSKIKRPKVQSFANGQRSHTSIAKLQMSKSGVNFAGLRSCPFLKGSKTDERKKHTRKVLGFLAEWQASYAIVAQIIA